MANQSAQVQHISLEFMPLAVLDFGAFVPGTDILLLMRDPWQGCGEILNVRFDGEHFFYKGQKVMPISAIAGWAALPYKLLRQKQGGSSVVDDVYRPPRYAGDELILTLQLAQMWIRQVQSTLSIGMVPSAVPGELIEALSNLPNTLSQLVPIRDVNRQDSLSDQIPS